MYNKKYRCIKKNTNILHINSVYIVIKKLERAKIKQISLFN